MRDVTRWPRRTKVLAATLTGALALTTAVIFASPQAQEAIAGPSEEQVALQRERARSADLKAQLDAATEQLSQPRPQVEDRTAQVDDLRARLETADAKLSRPRPSRTDPSAQARADDLRGQLSAAEGTIGDLATEASQVGSQRARAEDLRAQPEDATAEVDVLAARAGDSSQRARAEDLKAQLDDAAETVAGLSARAQDGQVQGARADDLKQQLDAAGATVADLVAQVDEGGVQRARAEDLKRQLESAAATVAALSGQVDAGLVQGARADDLKRQLDAAGRTIADLSAQAAQLPVEQARAADLKRQVEELSRKLSQPPAPESEPPVVASLTKQEIVEARQQLGLYTQQSPFDYSEFQDVERSMDREATISGYFQSWATDFRPDAVRAAWSRDQVPLLTWESQAQIGAVTAEQPDYSLSTIIEGGQDDYIRRYARDITATGLPLILRFDHEMNGTWYPWSETSVEEGRAINGNAPGEYARMWRHVHDIFEAEGANDYVVWLWSPNRVDATPQQPAPEAFYPGDDYVDWVGMTGYRRPNYRSATFDHVYSRTLPLLEFAGKPVFLSEVGAGGTREEKTAFVEDFFDGLDRHPEIVGFAWFNIAVPTEDGTNDWRINVDRAPREAFAAGVARTGFGRPLE